MAGDRNKMNNLIRDLRLQCPFHEKDLIKSIKPCVIFTCTNFAVASFFNFLKNLILAAELQSERTLTLHWRRTWWISNIHPAGSFRSVVLSSAATPQSDRNTPLGCLLVVSASHDNLLFTSCSSLCMYTFVQCLEGSGLMVWHKWVCQSVFETKVRHKLLHLTENSAGDAKKTVKTSCHIFLE